MYFQTEVVWSHLRKCFHNFQSWCWQESAHWQSKFPKFCRSWQYPPTRFVFDWLWLCHWLWKRPNKFCAGNLLRLRAFVDFDSGAEPHCLPQWKVAAVFSVTFSYFITHYSSRNRRASFKGTFHVANHTSPDRVWWENKNGSSKIDDKIPQVKHHSKRITEPKALTPIVGSAFLPSDFHRSTWDLRFTFSRYIRCGKLSERTLCFVSDERRPPFELPVAPTANAPVQMLNAHMFSQTVFLWQNWKLFWILEIETFVFASLDLLANSFFAASTRKCFLKPFEPFAQHLKQALIEFYVRVSKCH